MSKRIALLGAMLALAGCTTAWPRSSYVVLQDDRDATPLVQSVVDQVVACAQPGQSIELLPPQDGDNMLTAMILADLKKSGINVVPSGGTHRIQYIAAPTPGGELLRIAIDGNRGGSQFFARNTAGTLQVGGPFMELQP